MSKILRGISESVEQNDDMFSAVLEYLGQTQPDLFSRYGDEKVANTVQTVVATANDYLGGPKKFAQQVISNLQSPSEVDEGEVVQFPKKHKGDLEGVDSCPKCGGDLLSGKYMGHAVKVCNPCKQVYLPPNSGIDQRGNKIDEEDMAEADAKPIDMKRWLRDFERREDKNFHTENVIAIAKLVGGPEDIKMANDIKKEHMKQGGLSHELYTFRQMLYKKLWPLVQQKIEDSQSQGVAEGTAGVSVKKWANQVRKDHGSDIKFVNRKEGGGAVDIVRAINSQGETVGVYNRKTGYPTVYEPQQGVAEGWKDKVAGGALALGALGGIGALQNAAPNVTVQGHQMQLANPGTQPDDAKLVTTDDGKKIYAWKTTGQKNRSQWVYRPVEQVKEQGVAEAAPSTELQDKMRQVRPKGKGITRTELQNAMCRKGKKQWHCPECATYDDNVHGKFCSKYKPKEQGVAEGTGNNKADAMMSKITSKKSLDTREALAMVTDLLYHQGASFKEALQKASISYEIDQSTLLTAYKKLLKNASRINQGVAEESNAPVKYRATVEYGPTAADAHFVTVTASSTEEAEAKVQKWCEKKGVRNPMITINGADKPVDVAEGGYPDVDHMPGLVNKYNRTPVKPASNNKFYTDKKQWLRDVDDINHSKYDDNSEYIGQTGRSSVEINGVPWAVWSDAKQKGYIAMGAMSEEKQRLDPKCWKGYKKQGTKMKGDTRVNNCVPIEETEKEADYGDDYQSMVGRVGQKAKEQEKKKPVDIAALARRLNKPEPKKVDEFVSGTVMARPRHVPSQVELQKRKSDIMKGIDENLGTPYPSTYEKENNPFKHKGAHRTTALTSESKKK